MNNYYETYKLKHQEIKAACNFITTNSCNNLEIEIQDIKSSIDKITLLNWQDSVVDQFMLNKENCSKKLKDIIDSIEYVFKKAEDTYEKLNEQLENLKNVNDTIYHKKIRFKTLF